MNSKFVLILLAVAASVQAQSPKCKTCTDVIKRVEDSLTNDANEPKIRDALSKVCESVPLPVKGLCKDFVEKHATDVIKAIAKREPPATICKQLTFCD